MKLFAGLAGLTLLAALAAPAYAGSVDGNAVIGGALGGGAGAAVGSAVGGRNGAIVGGAVGGAAGAALMATDTRVVREREVYYDDDHHDNGKHRGHHKNKHKHGGGYRD